MKHPRLLLGRAAASDCAPDLDARSTELLEQWAAELRARIDGPVTTTVRIGWPGAGILAVIDGEPSVDLVIMGTHGRTGLRRGHDRLGLQLRA